MQGGGELVLDYRFSVRSAADAHYTRRFSELTEGAPNPLSTACAEPGAPHSGRFKVRACGEIGLTEYEVVNEGGSDLVFNIERARSHISRNHSFEFNIPIWLDGECWMTRGGKTHHVNAREFLVTDTEQMARARIVNRGHACTLSFPASWDRIGDIRLEGAFSNIYSGVDRNNQGLISYARHLLAQPEALAQPDASAKLYDVIALALNPRAKSEHAAGFLALMRNHIDVHYSDPDLGPEHVAASFGISVRHLHRLFAASGVTFSERVLERRLEQAARMLRHPRFQEYTILSIAFSCGFRDINHFGRRFRMRFGETPREFRQPAANPRRG